MIELLAPAGNLEKLQYAISYGADAVYVGGGNFNLRYAAAKYDIDQIQKAREITLAAGKKLYVALNIFAHNADFESLKDFLKSLSKVEPDALVIADPGIFSFAKQICPDINIHISTQANVTNLEAANFWAGQGAKRVTLARELTLEEIEHISKNALLETEVFVHGAMCLSYSGRCYLSHHMTQRDANRGDCAQSCRWNYVLVEEKRPDQAMEIFENDRGTYIMSSKDLCLADEIPSLIKAGVSSFKIEGRMKSLHYVSTVTKVYREIIDKALEQGNNFEFSERWRQELKKISHRQYTKGFFGKEGENMQVEGKQSYFKTTDFVGAVQSSNGQGTTVLVKNRIIRGDKLEVLAPTGDNKEVSADFYDKEGQPLEEVHANSTVIFKENWPPMSLIRRKLVEDNKC